MVRLFGQSFLLSLYVSCMNKYLNVSLLSFTSLIEASNFLGSLCYQWRKIDSNVPTHYLYPPLRWDGTEQDSDV